MRSPLSRYRAAGLLLLVAANVARADGEAASWLMKITMAAERTDYSGTFVYLHDGQVEAMRVHRATGEAGTRERLYSLSGSAREIIRNDDQVWCYLPEEKKGITAYRKTSDRSFPRLLPDNAAALDAHYSLAAGTEERVAERLARRLAVRPRDDWRYGYDLWADTDTGLLLKASVLSPDGTPVEQYMFTEVTINGAVAADDLKPATPAGELVWYRPEEMPVPENQEADHWEAAELPPGFAETARMRRLSALRRHVIEHIVYSDGLATVSVFVDPTEDDGRSPARGVSSMGAVHAFSTVIDGHHVTVVGEVPGPTVELIAGSIRRR